MSGLLHPDLAAEALEARRRSRASDTNHAAHAYFLGWVHCLTAITGADHDEIAAWLDRHEAANMGR